MGETIPFGKCGRRSPARTFVLVVAIVACSCLSGCSSPVYLAKLGWGQARIILQSKPNEAVLEDPAVSEPVKEKIRLVLEARTYGGTKLGLAGTSSFSRYYQVEGPCLLYVVTACPKDRLEAYRWWFPITGWVTAKGFFSYRDAIREKEKLEARGFDVFIQGAQAYSTLGWFKDPIFSTFLFQEPAMVVNVVLHELTHATVFFKNELDFNEQVATFVGGQGAIDFTKAKFGVGSSSHRLAIGLLEDGILFADFMRGVAQALHVLYAQPVSVEAKLSRRVEVFRRAKEEFDALKARLKTDFYLGFEDVELNNAAMIALTRYVTRVEEIQRVYERLDKNLRRTVAFLRKIQEDRIKDPEGYVTWWLGETESGELPARDGDRELTRSPVASGEKRVQPSLVILRHLHK